MAGHLDAHAKPPARLREVYKDFHKLKASSLDQSPHLIQFDNGGETTDVRLKATRVSFLPTELRHVILEFMDRETPVNPLHPLDDSISNAKIYEVPNVPGLLIYPRLLPPSVQLSLLDRLLHRDLSNPQHQTNVHLHYRMPYPPSLTGGTASFFHDSAADLCWLPKDANMHKAFDIIQFLNKKLRWTTLGGQYDWTNKVYPEGAPPAFPQDIKRLVEDIFPMKAEAAIVNLYSPGDTLSLHRDVSEECNRPLVSISLGCDAIFICGLEPENDEGPRVATIRLRSGDAVLMSGESRYAWHGVPKIVADTCPSWMQDWPAASDVGQEFEQWRGWMKGKRVNLNVRQMFA